MTNRPMEVDNLIPQYRAGYGLPRGFYTSQAVYDHEIASVWNKNWIWVGHESQIPEPGDYFLFDYDVESIIVVRSTEGEVRAHLNVCRHRGSRVCTKASGKARSFVCPYHAWTYDLSGNLRGGRAMGPDFKARDWGLMPVQVQVFQGMILVCASKDAPPIEQSLSQLAPLTAPFDFENLQVAHTASYPVPANWKLAMENYLECYHCAPAHLEYSRSHTLKAPQEMAAHLGPMQERACKAGLPKDVLDLFGPNAPAPGADVFYRRYPLFEGYKTGSRTGEPLAPLLGNLTGFDGGATDIQLGTLNHFLTYSDHVVGYRFVPRGLQDTYIQVVWMVRGDARPHQDYSPDDLIWLWHSTSRDDERIIRHNQEGVNSHFFQPGPLAEMETAIQGFYDFYLAMISDGPKEMRKANA